MLWEISSLYCFIQVPLASGQIAQLIQKITVKLINCAMIMDTDSAPLQVSSLCCAGDANFESNLFVYMYQKWNPTSSHKPDVTMRSTSIG